MIKNKSIIYYLITLIFLGIAIILILNITKYKSLQKLNKASIEEIQTYLKETQTGFIEYIDNDWNTSKRLTIGSTIINFSMDNYSKRDQEKPFGITDWWNGTHILTSNPGNSYLIRLRFNTEPQGITSYCEALLNIGSGVDPLPFRLITFPKGISVESDVSFTNLEYTLDTWYKNGAYISIYCSDDVEFWDISLTIQRIHKGRGFY